MALKSALIVAMLLGLVSYARSKASATPPGPSRDAFIQIFKRNGYVKVETISQPDGLLDEAFELRPAGGLRDHSNGRIHLNSRDGVVVGFCHTEPDFAQ